MKSVQFCVFAIRIKKASCLGSALAGIQRAHTNEPAVQTGRRTPRHEQRSPIAWGQNYRRISRARRPASMGFTTLLLLGCRSTALEFGELSAFVRRHGGRVHRSLAIADPAPCGSRGVVAAQGIPENDAHSGPLVVVPASLEINAARARNALANVPGIDDIDNVAVVVLWLATLDAERRRAKEDVFWGPYLRSLPQDITELPNGWAPLISGDEARYEALLDGAARGDAATREMCNQEANRAAAYASRASHGLARDFGSSTGVDAAARRPRLHQAPCPFCPFVSTIDLSDVDPSAVSAVVHARCGKCARRFSFRNPKYGGLREAGACSGCSAAPAAPAAPASPVRTDPPPVTRPPPKGVGAVGDFAGDVAVRARETIRPSTLEVPDDAQASPTSAAVLVGGARHSGEAASQLASSMLASCSANDHAVPMTWSTWMSKPR